MKVMIALMVIIFVLAFTVGIRNQIPVFQKFFDDDELKGWKVAVILAPAILSVFLVMFASLYI